jgi:hypothetical protein
LSRDGTRRVCFPEESAARTKRYRLLSKNWQAAIGGRLKELSKKLIRFGDS